MKTKEDPTTERVIFNERRGWMKYGKIPYQVFYQLDIQNSSIVSGIHPARYSVTENTGGGSSLSVWIHESVPNDFEEAVFYHELVEAELWTFFGLSQKEAHSRAVGLTFEYIKKFISDKEKPFLEWHNGILSGI